MPVQFSNLSKMGRFGNQLFQIAASSGLAKRYNTTWRIPRWEHAHLFETKFPEKDPLPTPDTVVKELKFTYDIEHFDKFDFKGKNIDIVGYFQNEKYFDPTETRKLFKFRPEVVEEVREKYKRFFTKPTIAVGVRRGDYLTNGNYHILDPKHYILALQQFNYKDYNIIFMSDDIQYAWFHYKCLPNAFFPTFDSDIEAFICGTLMDNWIIGNSTFHWWQAYLSNAERVIQPAQLFKGDLLEKEGDVNFYIEKEGWEILDTSKHKIPLPDVTITIPVKLDHEDRKKNLEMTLSMIQKDFDVKIVVGEQGGDKFEYVSQWVEYRKFDYEFFHRTKMLNIMAKEATTDIVVNYDADVLFAPMQFFQAIEVVRSGEADFSYPYGYAFIRVPRIKHRNLYTHYDLAAFAPIMNGNDSEVRPSVGGAVVFNRELFLENGGENEAFKQFSPEDVERFERFTRLGLRCKRIKGHLYHLDHYIGVTSCMKNPYYQQGVEELQKERAMTTEELREYVKSWK